MKKRKVFVFLFGLACILSFLTPRVLRADAEYVGSETCKGCHEDYYKSFLKSVHGKKAIPGSPMNREGCESCHGPGGQHAEKGGGKGLGILAFGRKLDPRERSAKCLTCHEETKTLAFWNMNRHKAAGNSCDSCHSVHKGVEKLLVAKEPDLCFNCHKNIRAQVNKQSHHPLKEAFVGRQALKCSSCHNTMGSFSTEPIVTFSGSRRSGTDKMIKADSVNDLCFKCHAEKRGPFMWQHPPVEENCLICHEAHGSNHGKLLTSRVPLLCQNCHSTIGSHPRRPYTNLHSFQGTATANKNKFFARSCLNCHTSIHGSNGPAERGEAFLR
jgi:DmsE family decaheme c-type cytochrome